MFNSGGELEQKSELQLIFNLSWWRDIQVLPKFVLAEAASTPTDPVLLQHQQSRGSHVLHMGKEQKNSAGI